MRREQRRRLGALMLLLLGVLLVRRFNWREFIPFKMWSRGIGLQAVESMFKLEGKPFRIFGGSMHYFRVPRDYWRDRMLKMKACGLNTLTTYVAWNLHEPARGKFDFSGNLDIEAFIKIAADVGLWVIMRPGPYICAEWDLGGLPSWLLRDKNMELRTTYKGFTEATDAFFDKLIPKLARYQYRKGGPIIAVQVENEYGSYAKDPNYLDYVKTALLKRGIVELLMTSDNKDGLSSGSLEGVLATINFQKLEPVLFSYLDTIQSKKPKMVMEYWTGWFDHWGSDHHVFDADMVAKTIQNVLKTGASINLYMFHGGTNFGFMNGALHFQEYKADVTSYDYDAPLTESGDYTSKYFKLRDLFSKFTEEPLPIPPSTMTKGSYGMVEFKQYVSLWDVLQSTEEVFVSNQLVGSIDYNNLELNIAEVPGYRKLRFLVENCGRVNYGPKQNTQRKGIIGDVLLRNSPLRNFKIYSLDMKKSFIESLQVAQWNDVPDEPVGPAFFRGTLRVGFIPLDTFLKLEGWEKGAAFVNGQNLGRYWDIGPQGTLYLPGTWLHPGENEIIIFEQYRAGRILQSLDVPLLGKTLYVD
ncbi:beta-galactosidase-1-like protein 2 isoform X4 [Microcaecilia unicolor]|uniref:Beta-galactosidase-1-like protein 2 isoform X4 n=1 Tax=Microcaecilia unicolor TaxID=1415580 RepID=A0A6P7ZUZ8_9AMPH|nr:beta-galactosidase-1-like protein 2 isoform X4 [Microcaecilia unicolor]